MMLDSAAQQTILSRPEPFLIGLHGPDILFYYHVLTNNKVNAVGFGTHARPAKEFFAPAKAAVEKGGAPAFGINKEDAHV